MKLFGHNPTTSAWFGLVVVTLFVFIAVFTPLLAPYPESANHYEARNDTSHIYDSEIAAQTFARARVFLVDAQSLLQRLEGVT